MVLSISEDKWTATWSLRAPAYFNIVEMLKTADHLLERYGGHSQAWGLTVKLNKLDKLKAHFIDYANENISDDELIKVVDIDTELLHHEWDHTILSQIDKLEPFGMWNQEPIFLIQWCIVSSCGKVWQRGKGHLKLTVELEWDKKANALRRSHGDLIWDYVAWTNINIIGTIKVDDYNGGYFIDCKEVIINE